MRAPYPVFIVEHNQTTLEKKTGKHKERLANANGGMRWMQGGRFKQVELHH